jgi:hypothetical protein
MKLIRLFLFPFTSFSSVRKFEELETGGRPELHAKPLKRVYDEKFFQQVPPVIGDLLRRQIEEDEQNALSAPLLMHDSEFPVIKGEQVEVKIGESVHRGTDYVILKTDMDEDVYIKYYRTNQPRDESSMYDEKIPLMLREFWLLRHLESTNVVAKPLFLSPETEKDYYTVTRKTDCLVKESFWRYKSDLTGVSFHPATVRYMVYREPRFVTLEDLRETIMGRPINLAWSLKTLTSVLHALRAIHEKGVIVKAVEARRIGTTGTEGIFFYDLRTEAVFENEAENYLQIFFKSTSFANQFFESSAPGSLVPRHLIPSYAMDIYKAILLLGYLAHGKGPYSEHQLADIGDHEDPRPGYMYGQDADVLLGNVEGQPGLLAVSCRRASGIQRDQLTDILTRLVMSVRPFIRSGDRPDYDQILGLVNEAMEIANFACLAPL